MTARVRDSASSANGLSRSGDRGVGQREVGTVTEGKYADIIAVRGDVLRFINLLQRVELVIKRGVRYR